MVKFNALRLLAGLFLGGMLAVPTVFAQDSEAREMAAIRDLLTSTQPNMEVGEIKPSPIAGLYEVSIQNGQTLYASGDARYFIPGDLYQAGPQGMVNLGEQNRNDWRAAKIAAVDESDMIVFEAEGARQAALTVFTDVDCPYCRKLHAEVPELNKMGIAVRYLAYPRTGLNTETHRKMVSAWCADDPKSIMTSAKRGGTVPEADCDDPVAAQYQLGREVGVTGTPALVLPSGEIVPGYVPAETLASYLLGGETQ